MIWQRKQDVGWVADRSYTKYIHIDDVMIIRLWSITRHVADPHSPNVLGRGLNTTSCRPVCATVLSCTKGSLRLTN